MELLVISEMAMREIESAIVNATHMATDATGEKLTLSTIDSRTLQTAARVALEIATGMVIWPGNQQLRIKPQRRTTGIFEIEG